MQIIPAIDIKNNKCVRLLEGVDDTSKIYNNNPVEQAKYFEQTGCKKLHIVDLDAAFGRPHINTDVIKEIRKTITIPIQMGGGIRSKADAEKYLNWGIDNIIIGSMSVNQPDVIKSLSKKFKRKIYVSLDIKDNKIMVKGWKEQSEIKIEEILDLYLNTDIKGYVITDIKNDGMLKGLDTEFIKNIVQKIENIDNYGKGIIIAGGLTNYDDLKNLNRLKMKNVEGIVSGKSFYEGNIDLVKAQKILDNNAQG